MDRRDFLSAMAVSGVVGAVGGVSNQAQGAVVAQEDKKDGGLVASPPVVQNPTADSFGVSWAVKGLATGYVEWGLTQELGKVAKADHHGLAHFNDQILSVRVKGLNGAREIYYRTVTVGLEYRNAYNIKRMEPVYGQVRKLKLPSAAASSAHLSIINDTHQNKTTLKGLADRINTVDSDLLLWNGDISNDFYDQRILPEVCLGGGAKVRGGEAGGWAATRPLLFVPGNHDVRGRYAQGLCEALTPWEMEAGDPEGLSNHAWRGGRYCFALRIGPLAVVGLDTGEDKPDERGVFAGLAAYEPYRRAQAQWLKGVLKSEEIASAPYLIACSHIPLRGRAGHNDGLGTRGYAGYSGQGHALWLPELIKAKCNAIISGHTHGYRSDDPTEALPIRQIVGGGPQPNRATHIQVKADDQGLRIWAEDLQGKHKDTWRFKKRS